MTPPNTDINQGTNNTRTQIQTKEATSPPPSPSRNVPETLSVQNIHASKSGRVAIPLPALFGALQAINLNFRFTGAPGTGKTTVAQRVGRMFKQLSVVHSDDVVSCSPSDFTTG